MFEYLDYHTQLAAIPDKQLQRYHNKLHYRIYLLRHAPRCLEFFTRRRAHSVYLRVFDYCRRIIRVYTFQRFWQKPYQLLSGYKEQAIRTRHDGNVSTNLTLMEINRSYIGSGWVTLLANGTISLQSWSGMSSRTYTESSYPFIEMVGWFGDLVVGRCRDGRVLWTLTSEKGFSGWQVLP